MKSILASSFIVLITVATPTIGAVSSRTSNSIADINHSNGTKKLVAHQTGKYTYRRIKAKNFNEGLSILKGNFLSLYIKEKPAVKGSYVPYCHGLKLLSDAQLYIEVSLRNEPDAAKKYSEVLATAASQMGISPTNTLQNYSYWEISDALCGASN